MHEHGRQHGEGLLEQEAVRGGVGGRQGRVRGCVGRGGLGQAAEHVETLHRVICTQTSQFLNLVEPNQIWDIISFYLN